MQESVTWLSDLANWTLSQVMQEENIKREYRKGKGEQYKRERELKEQKGAGSMRYIVDGGREHRPP